MTTPPALPPDHGLRGYNGLPLPVVPEETLESIRRRHGLGMRPIRLQPWSGAMNTIYELGDDLLLRVPMTIPEAVSCILAEALVLPMLDRHGIRAPRLVVADETHDLLDVPYTIYERLHGISMDWWEAQNSGDPGLYEQIGRELAVLHSTVLSVPDHGDRLRVPQRSDPEELLGLARLPRDARIWIEQAFERLRPAVEAFDEPPVFLHSDVRPGNTVVDGHFLVGLIDWGSAGWGDPVLDFSALWVWALPAALRGYREVAPLAGDDSAEARILWDHLVRVLMLEGAIDVLRGIDWIVHSSDGIPPWVRDWLPRPPPT
jgi:aminoglycoside phosphotransferase (APT) family kinase protein